MSSAINDQLRIMVYRHSVFYSPLIAAIAGDFLKDEGLGAVYFQKPAERNHYEMFRAGEVDIMQAAVSTSWDPLSKGIRDIPVHFAQINQRDGFFLTGRPGGPPFDWKQLEGSGLVADHGQQPFAMLKYALHLVIQAPPEEVAELEASFFPGFSLEAIAAAISRYQQLGTWRSDPRITREQYEFAMDIFIFANVFKERYVYEDVVVSIV